MIYAAGIAAACVTPFDNIKTRMQNQFSDPSKNRLNYLSSLECVSKGFINEGWTFPFIGAYTNGAKIFIYGMTSVWLTSWMIDTGKRNNGVPEEKI